MKPLYKAGRGWYTIQDIDDGPDRPATERRNGMKKGIRTILLLAAALVLSTAALAEDGLRGYTKEDGYVYLHLGQYKQTAEGGVLPILWRVLTADEEKAYLLSEYILFARALHTDRNAYAKFKGDFAQTELCQYLNTTFAEEAFTEEELSLLLPCENFGKVFLITREDMKNKEIGLGAWTSPKDPTLKQIEANPAVRAWGTEWAIENNGYPKDEYPDPKAKIRNATDTANITVGEKRLYVFQAKYGACSPYWGRSQSTTNKTQAVCTKDGGQVGRIEVGRDNEGVRPAVYLAAGSYVIVSGSGTMEDPYEIAPANAAE